MRTQSKFLIHAVPNGKLYQLELDGTTWTEFPVQPPGVNSVGMLCGTPDGRIAICNGASNVKHYDPITQTWESIVHPGLSPGMYMAHAIGPNGDMVSYAPSGYALKYVAATKTWTRIYGPAPIISIHGVSLDDIWIVGYNASIGYLYHMVNGVLSANLWDAAVVDIGFWPHTPRQIFAVSPTEVYITTWPGSLSYGYEQYGQILKFDGARWRAINPADALPTPYGDGIPDCAGWDASSSAIHNGLIVSDEGKIYTSGNFITITTNYIKEFGAGWTNIGTFNQTSGSCYAPIIATKGTLLLYGTDGIRRYRSGAWDLTTGFVGSGGSQPAILYGPDYPEIEIITPFDGQDPVNPRGWIEFNVLDGDNPAAPGATTASIAGVPAWSGDAALTGFTGSRTPITGGHHYIIYRTSGGWTSGEVVAVSVHAEDTLGLEVDETWSFTALVDLPTCVWGGGEYGEPEPPYGLCPTRETVTVTTEYVDRLGGTEIEIEGTFAPGMLYAVTIGGRPCYSGQPGYGYLCPAISSSVLRAITPPSELGEQVVDVEGRVGSVIVVEHHHRSKQLSVRACFPPWASVGPRRIEED